MKRRKISIRVLRSFSDRRRPFPRRSHNILISSPKTINTAVRLAEFDHTLKKGRFGIRRITVIYSINSRHGMLPFPPFKVHT
jgi:hypothetical protein